MRMAAFMGNSQWGEFRHASRVGSRLEYFRKITRINPQCLSIRKGKNLHTAIIYKNAKSFVQIHNLGLYRGYSLVVPFRPFAYDNWVKAGLQDYLDGNLAAEVANSYVESKNTYSTAILIDELVSFPFPDESGDVRSGMESDYANSYELVRQLHRQLGKFLPPMRYVGGRIVVPDNCKPPLLACWVEVDDIGEKLAKICGFTCVENSVSAKGTHFRRYELNFAEVGEPGFEKKRLQRVLHQFSRHVRFASEKSKYYHSKMILETDSEQQRGEDAAGPGLVFPTIGTSKEATTARFSELIDALDNLGANPPATVSDALKELRNIGRQFSQLISPWVSRVLNFYKGRKYPDLEAKREVGADITAAVKGFGLEVADPETKVPGSLYARTSPRESPDGRFTVEYPTNRGTRSRTLDQDHPEVTLAPSDTAVRKKRTPPDSSPET